MLSNSTIEHTRRPPNLNGPAGLLTAVIYQATIDAKKGSRNAIAYFNGPVYREHLELLGLPVDWLPEALSCD